MLGVVLSPLIAAAGIWYSNTQVRDQLTVTQEGQITDRYSKAVENLGDDAMDVRLGGVYALQRIMQDSPRDHPTVANVLATYVRSHAGKPSKKGGEVPADVLAALNVLVRRDVTRDKSFVLDLRNVHLPRIEAGEEEWAPSTKTRAIPAGLRGANLYGAFLRGANLRGANLGGADLREANLDEADLGGADLRSANLPSASLRSVYLRGADLRDANLGGAGLRGAILFIADLGGADLREANLDEADLGGADLGGADLSDADLGGALLFGADLSDAGLRGADLFGADLSGVNLRGADLSDVDGLNTHQVVSAVIDSTTILPEGLADSPAVKARIAEVEKKASAGQ